MEYMTLCRIPYLLCVLTKYWNKFSNIYC